MNEYTKFSASLNIFRYKNESTFVSVTESQTHKQFAHWSFRSPEGLKRLQKNFQANRRKKFMEFRFHNTSFRRTTIFFCVFKNIFSTV